MVTKFYILDHWPHALEGEDIWGLFEVKDYSEEKDAIFAQLVCTASMEEVGGMVYRQEVFSWPIKPIFESKDIQVITEAQAVFYLLKGIPNPEYAEDCLPR